MQCVQKGTPKPPTPVGSAGKQPATSPAAQQSLAPELQTPPAASFLEQLSSMTPQDALLQGAPTSPMGLISSLQRPSSSARNPLMPAVSLYDSLPGVCKWDAAAAYASGSCSCRDGVYHANCFWLLMLCASACATLGGCCWSIMLQRK